MCWVSLPETHMQEPSRPCVQTKVSRDPGNKRGPAWERVVPEAGAVGPLPSVCNAGRGLLGPLEAHSADAVGSVLDVNVVGTVRLLQAFLPDMKRRGSGHILVTASMGGLMGEWKRRGLVRLAWGCCGMAGSLQIRASAASSPLKGMPFNAVYCASKFAIEGLCESLAVLLPPFGVQ